MRRFFGGCAFQCPALSAPVESAISFSGPRHAQRHRSFLRSVDIDCVRQSGAGRPRRISEMSVGPWVTEALLIPGMSCPLCRHGARGGRAPRSRRRPHSRATRCKRLDQCFRCQDLDSRRLLPETTSAVQLLCRALQVVARDKGVICIGMGCARFGNADCNHTAQPDPEASWNHGGQPNVGPHR